MSVEYRIPAMPTMYDGIQYRSRLEAQWGAFFGLLGWRFEYEPFELNGWIPDFLLHGKHWPILVEVKPVTAFPADVADKIEKATESAGRLIRVTRKKEMMAVLDKETGTEFLEEHETEEYEPLGELLIVGCSIPILGCPWSGGEGMHETQIGWMFDTWYGSGWGDGRIVSGQSQAYGLTTFQGGWIDRIGDADRFDCRMGNCDMDAVLALWREAKNLVQWKGVRSKTDAAGSAASEAARIYSRRAESWKREASEAARILSRQTECETWLRGVLASGQMRVSEVRNQAAANGFDLIYLYKAKLRLNVIESDTEGYKTWAKQ